jgi:hypothetical protein
MPINDKSKYKTNPEIKGNDESTGKVRPDANISNLSEIMKSQSKFKKMQAKVIAKFFRRS